MSASFYWPEQIAWPAQLLEVGGRLLRLLMGRDSKSHCTGCGLREGREWGPFCNQSLLMDEEKSFH